MSYRLRIILVAWYIDVATRDERCFRCIIGLALFLSLTRSSLDRDLHACTRKHHVTGKPLNLFFEQELLP